MVVVSVKVLGMVVMVLVAEKDGLRSGDPVMKTVLTVTEMEDEFVARRSRDSSGDGSGSSWVAGGGRGWVAPTKPFPGKHEIYLANCQSASLIYMNLKALRRIEGEEEVLEVEMRKRRGRRGRRGRRRHALVSGESGKSI